MLRTSWYDPIDSQNVQKILETSATLDMWKPERLDLVADTMAADIMVASHEGSVAIFDNCRKHLLFSFVHEISSN